MEFVEGPPSDFSHTVSGYVPTVPGTVGDWENCMAQSYVPVRNSDPLMQSETSENSLGYGHSDSHRTGGHSARLRSVETTPDPS